MVNHTKEILTHVGKAVEEMDSFFREKPNESHYVASIPDANANPKVNFQLMAPPYDYDSFLDFAKRHSESQGT